MNVLKTYFDYFVCTMVVLAVIGYIVARIQLAIDQYNWELDEKRLRNHPDIRKYGMPFAPNTYEWRFVWDR